MTELEGAGMDVGGRGDAGGDRQDVVRILVESRDLVVGGEVEDYGLAKADGG